MTGDELWLAVNNVDGKAFGTMLITLPEEPELKEKVLNYLNNHAGITAEEVKRHD